MALVICYDPQGKKHEKELVDAKECVDRCGFTMTPAGQPVEKIKQVEDKKSSGPPVPRTPTVEEIKTGLSGATDDELLDMLDAETKGKNRTTAIEAIEAEIAARQKKD